MMEINQDFSAVISAVPDTAQGDVPTEDDQHSSTSDDYNTVVRHPLILRYISLNTLP